jgi:hypothetical protein
MKAFLVRGASRFPLLSFLLLTFLITWGAVFYVALGEAGRLGHKPSVLWLALFGQFGPLWAALLMTGLLAGTSGVRALLRRTLAFRMDRVVWAVILLFAPLGFLISVGGFGLLTGRGLELGRLATPQVLVGVGVGTLVGLIFGGLSEELGWRGFLLPRLQGRMSPLIAGILVGVVWSLWHLEPEHVALGLRQGWRPFWGAWAPHQGRYLLETIPFSVFMTALFNRSRGNLLAMMLVHAISNAFTAEVWSVLKPIPFSLRVWDTTLVSGLALACLWAWRRGEVQREPGTGGA